MNVSTVRPQLLSPCVASSVQHWIWKEPFLARAAYRDGFSWDRWLRVKRCGSKSMKIDKATRSYTNIDSMVSSVSWLPFQTGRLSIFLLFCHHSEVLHNTHSGLLYVRSFPRGQNQHWNKSSLWFKAIEQPVCTYFKYRFQYHCCYFILFSFKCCKNLNNQVSQVSMKRCVEGPVTG